MLNKKIAILGGGNLRLSIAEGLIKSKLFIPENICVGVIASYKKVLKITE